MYFPSRSPTKRKRRELFSGSFKRNCRPRFGRTPLPIGSIFIFRRFEKRAYRSRRPGRHCQPDESKTCVVVVTTGRRECGERPDLSPRQSTVDVGEPRFVRSAKHSTPPPPYQTKWSEQQQSGGREPDRKSKSRCA